MKKMRKTFRLMKGIFHSFLSNKSSLEILTNSDTNKPDD